MKKIIKSRIFLVVLTAIIFTSIGVYAAVQYNASQITYNKNGKATVEAALNDLYSKSNKTLEFDEPLYAEYKGNNQVSSSTSLDLPKGEYILSLTSSLAFISQSFTSVGSNSQEADIKCNSNNCVIDKLSSSLRTQAGSNADNYGYTVVRNYTFMYHVVIKEDTDSIIYSTAGENQKTVPKIMNIHAIKIK